MFSKEWIRGQKISLIKLAKNGIPERFAHSILQWWTREDKKELTNDELVATEKVEFHVQNTVKHLSADRRSCLAIASRDLVKKGFFVIPDKEAHERVKELLFSFGVYKQL